jgi:hypothetical protein
MTGFVRTSNRIGVAHRSRRQAKKAYFLLDGSYPEMHVVTGGEGQKAVQGLLVPHIGCVKTAPQAL